MQIGSNRRRFLVAKLGLDGHDVGARVIARSLSDSGIDVSYTGIRRSPEDVAAMAIECEATVVGVSILSGAHMDLLPKLRKLLDDAGASNTIIVAGGVIPQEDIPELKKAGIEEVFLSGTPLSNITAYIEEIFRNGTRNTATIVSD